MASFQRLWEKLDENHHASDTKAMAAIRTGLNISEDFWDNFLLVLGNSDALAELFDVPRVKITGMHHRIREALNKVQQSDAVPDPKKKGKMVNANSDELFGGGAPPVAPGDDL
jgi:hypothetical protein